MRVIASIAEAVDAVGQELGVSHWISVDQDRVDAFAEATGDHQWIHTDPVRAASGPFGTTIAHGYLTLSLLVPLLEQVLVIENRTSSLNYGLDKVRFPAPVPSAWRLTATLGEATDVEAGVQVKVDCVFEVEGQERWRVSPGRCFCITSRHDRSSNQECRRRTVENSRRAPLQLRRRGSGPQSSPQSRVDSPPIRIDCGRVHRPV
jgi:acyl dehydratase